MKEMMVVVIFHMFDRVSLTKHNPFYLTDLFGSHAAGWW